MAWFTDFYKAAVGKKAVMAITGILLCGFVLVHMVGNLHLYEGPEYMNEYGRFLRQVGAPAISEATMRVFRRACRIFVWLVHGRSTS